MKQSTIKDVRTTLIVLLVSILSSASAIYILPTVIAPVHAGFSNPAVTTAPSPVPVGTSFSVTVNVPIGQSVTIITVKFYNGTDAVHHPLKKTVSYSIASTPAFTVASSTFVSATTPLIAWPPQTKSNWFFTIEAGSTDPSSITANPVCTTTCTDVSTIAKTVNLS